jgi:GNAT superfamily N-acetyltransferase
LLHVRLLLKLDSISHDSKAPKEQREAGISRDNTCCPCGHHSNCAIRPEDAASAINCLIELRRALAGEADTLLAIQREAAVGAFAHIYPPERYPFPDHAIRAVWSEALSDPEVEVYVAEVDGVPAGAVSAGKGFLSTLYVLPAYQGSGVGSALHDLALDRLRAQGSREARLWTLEENDAGRRFYEQRGWSLTGETRVVPYPPHPIDVQYGRALDAASGNGPGR